MRLHDIAPKKGSRHRKRRLGRGISAGQGASCGKGMRGQKSRSGPNPHAGFEGGQMPLYKRIPKLKHFTIVNPRRYTTVNVGKLAALDPETQVTLDSLMEFGIVTADDGPLKLLGDGDVSVPLHVEAAAFTRSARAKIEAAGGSCRILGAPKVESEAETESAPPADPEPESASEAS